MRHPTDRLIAIWKDGAWQEIAAPKLPNNPNCLIVCAYGDWSGFRTAAKCLAQKMDNNRPEGFYRIVER